MSSRICRKPNAYSPQRRVALVRGGKAYFDKLCEIIKKARFYIHIQMYTFSMDETGIMVINTLKTAAARGVKVFLLFDGYATPDIDESIVDELYKAGIYIKRFEPLLRTKSLYFGRRLHHKIVTVDGSCALVGRNNLNNHYNDLPGKPSWLDFALYLEGSVAWELHNICAKQWSYANMSQQPASPLLSTETANYGNCHGSVAVRVRRNDWVNNKHEVWKSYFDLVSQAKRSVTIISSYFLPGRRLRKQMKLAAARGVNITVIVAGLSDVSVAKYAERYLYQWMLKHQITVYEYQRTILHAKLGLRDGRWMTLGSYNVNNISTYASIELNIDVRNRPFVSKVETELEEIIRTDCKRISAENINNISSVYHRAVQKTAYILIRFLLFLFTFYLKQHNRENDGFLHSSYTHGAD